MGQSESKSTASTDPSGGLCTAWQQRLASSCDGGVLLRHVVGLPTAVVPHIVVDDAVGPFVGGVPMTARNAAQATATVDCGGIVLTEDVAALAATAPHAERVFIGLASPDAAQVRAQITLLQEFRSLTTMKLGGVSWSALAPDAQQLALPPTLLHLTVYDVEWAVLGAVLRASPDGPVLHTLRVQGGDAALQDCHSEDLPCPALQSLQVLELSELRSLRFGLREALLTLHTLTRLELRGSLGSTKTDLSALSRLAHLTLEGDGKNVFHSTVGTVELELRHPEETLAFMPHVTDLTLRHTTIGAIPEHCFRKLDQLRHLRGGAELDARWLSHVAESLRTLEFAPLAHSPPAMHTNSMLPRLPALERLRFSKYLTPGSFSDVPNITALTADVYRFRVAELVAAVTHCPKLLHMSVPYGDLSVRDVLAACAVPNSPMGCLSTLVMPLAVVDSSEELPLEVQFALKRGVERHRPTGAATIVDPSPFWDWRKARSTP